jgi:hypothetical protein
LIVTRTPLISTNVFTPVVIAQGHHAALALAVATAAIAAVRGMLLPLDRRLATVKFTTPTRATVIRGLAGAVIVLAALGLAIGLPGRVAHAYHQFTAVNNDPGEGTARFASFSSDGRTEIWHVALKHGFAANPIHGVGAGTFVDLWNRYRDVSFDVLVAHSLYLNTLSDLGLVGIVLLVAVLLAIAVALGRRAFGGGGAAAAWAGLFAAAIAWFAFAGFDWNWQMPAATIWLFAAGGMALSRQLDASDYVGSGSQARRIWASWAARVAIAGAAIALAFIPLSVNRSQRNLNAAVAALEHGGRGDRARVHPT